jgi:hypothetical protein
MTGQRGHFIPVLAQQPGVDPVVSVVRAKQAVHGMAAVMRKPVAGAAG